GLPSPEMQFAELIAVHPGLAQPLKRVVHAHEDTIAHKGKDHSVGMHGTYPPECGFGGVEVQDRIHKLQCCQQTGEHAHDTPEDGSVSEPFHNFVVVVEFVSGLQGRYGRHSRMWGDLI